MVEGRGWLRERGGGGGEGVVEGEGRVWLRESGGGG